VSCSQAEGGDYIDMGFNSFMAGHLYQCPNGHLFVIGDCGQAVQVRLQMVLNSSTPQRPANDHVADATLPSF